MAKKRLLFVVAASATSKKLAKASTISLPARSSRFSGVRAQRHFAKAKNDKPLKNYSGIPDKISRRTVRHDILARGMF